MAKPSVEQLRAERGSSSVLPAAHVKLGGDSGVDLDQLAVLTPVAIFVS